MACSAMTGLDGRAAPSGTPATRSDFAACVDRCVRALIDGRQSAALNAQTQLSRWLGDDAVTLADGSPIDHALFDEAILSVQERVAPADGTPGLARLLRASREVAETIYAQHRPL
ncbi:MAG: hypothetical protein QM741_03925 [Rudaea sp.]|uniref:hypothetical protein n=1 Tax=Rudaea sp. TaxID=2136325 RepID=UPI0039E6150A